MGSSNDKMKGLDERAIAEIERIQGNFEIMARNWVQAEKKNLALQRMIKEIEAQKPSSSVVVEPPEATRPRGKAISTAEQTRQRNISHWAKGYRILRNASRSPPPSPRELLSSIENENNSSATDSTIALSDSGSDGYQGDSEASSRKFVLRPSPVPRTKIRSPRGLSLKTLATPSRARARRRSAREVCKQRKEERRPKRTRTSPTPPEDIKTRFPSRSSVSSLPSAPASQYPQLPPFSGDTRTPNPLLVRPPSPFNIERLPAHVAQEILLRIHIPSRDGLSILWEAITIAQHAFYDAALEWSPKWTHDLFPQGAHEVSFSMSDIEAYFARYSIGEGDFAPRGADSHKVLRAVRAMSHLRNRTCHFPPRSDARHHDLDKMPAAQAGHDGYRDALREGFSWPFGPDCAGWYYEATSVAWRLAETLADDGALAALDRLHDRIEDLAWSMLRAVEEVAALRAAEGGRGRAETREERREVARARVRALPLGLRVPLDMFFKDVKQNDHSWPLMIRDTAWWANAESK